MLTNKTLTHIALCIIGLASITHTTAHSSYKSLGVYNLPHTPKASPKPVLAARGGITTSGDDMGLWEITEYTSGYESTGKNPGDPGYGIAANGQPIEKGDVACDPRYHFGTRFYIDGIGAVVCSDRGSAIVGQHLDVYVPNLHQALQFGKQIRRVRVLGK